MNVLHKTSKKQKKIILLLLVLFLVSITFPLSFINSFAEEEKTFIKWVDFNADSVILKKVLQTQLKLRESGMDVDYSEVLAYIALKNGNKFSNKKDILVLQDIESAVKNGKTVDELGNNNKYYNYYKEAYHAIFDGIIGNYTQIENSVDTNQEGNSETKFGIKACFPIAKGYWFNHYDDFGNSRSYGFKRKHLGHDMMGSVGTPIVAIENGTITELGWNQYGGWRVGIRSLDGKRYYYYAHLRKGNPYPQTLKIGDTVLGGEVIGFLGMTGYSKKEDTNLKTGKPHLHLGLQLIFDESQVKGAGEIWVDVYNLCNFLQSEKVSVKKDADTKQYVSCPLKTFLI